MYSTTSIGLYLTPLTFNAIFDQPSYFKKKIVQIKNTSNVLNTFSNKTKHMLFLTVQRKSHMHPLPYFTLGSLSSFLG
jgi:hypothetical protein